MIGKGTLAAMATAFAITALAAEGDAHLKLYASGVEGDKALAEASTLKIDVPVMCREWHIWWGAPYGSSPHVPAWIHWDGLKKFGVYNPETTIEQTAQGSSWRRCLNCVGYPLLGPYDPNQPDIIRWQLETAKNAGIDSLHVHLWPSLWDEGRDCTPIETFERILDIAAKMNVTVGVHDEIMFRRPNITKAQTLESSIKRTTALLKRYGRHPGWQRIDGLPVYYFQNWSKWISPEDMQAYLQAVEKEAGPVYWMVEGSDDPKVFAIPQVKAVLCHNNSYFLHAETHGNPPHPWDKLLSDLKRASDLARANGKKFGVLVYTRFNSSNDRGKPGYSEIPGEDGMFFVDSLKKMAQFKPDFYVLTQWNDFEECGFIEPAWDFDGFNGDPYRYCRIVAAAQGKSFKPAPLPERSQLDPFIRRKLFGDSKPGDMGPVFQSPSLEGSTLKLSWTEGPEPVEVRIVQGELARWTPSDIEYKGQKLRLANWSALDEDGSFKPGVNEKGSPKQGELRFYAPGLVSSSPSTVWLGVRVVLPEKAKLSISYASPMENYRADSTWRVREASLRNGFSQSMADGSVLYWTPLHDAQFSGFEGDILVKQTGDRAKIQVKELIVWAPGMKGESLKPSASMPLPPSVDSAAPFVAVAYDAAGNPGLPRLMEP